jgi:hypothetical protein
MFPELDEAGLRGSSFTSSPSMVMRFEKFAQPAKQKEAMEHPEAPQGEPPVADAEEPVIRRGRASGSRLISLRNWPVSWRLFAVIMIALVMGLSFGGLRVAAATGTASEFARVSQLAVLGQQITGLAQAIEDERDAPRPAPRHCRACTRRPTRRRRRCGRSRTRSAARSRPVSRPR